MLWRNAKWLLEIGTQLTRDFNKTKVKVHKHENIQGQQSTNFRLFFDFD
jgi:hypothetical protein